MLQSFVLMLRSFIPNMASVPHGLRASLWPPTPWPPRLVSHRLVWWGSTDVVAVHLCTLDLVVAPVVSIMHVQVDRHTWERRVRLHTWGELIHVAGDTVFQFRGSPERVQEHPGSASAASGSAMGAPKQA